MFRSPSISESKRNNCYATKMDFCALLAREMDSLYVLALLLTADPYLAEKCFLEIVEAPFEEGLVFKEWLPRWVRRSFIKASLRLAFPPGEGFKSDCDPESATCLGKSMNRLIREVTSLEAAQRAAFVITMLEGYSDRECALLMGRSVHGIAGLRSAAINHFCPAGVVGRSPGERAATVFFPYGMRLGLMEADHAVIV